ncbi:MAG: MerR family transcriptional regulator [Opitutaceae bacterium]|jgi:DNA-binding transcriptional MerR regulator/methylmalonyl-CoA mutase cobalamin-binding subunit|nr:MerR family transcriptional regulator [Opitutaceae bacterium]
MPDIRYSIKIASERSGVSSHLIRMWEKRYGALSPDRTETNRRLYSDENVERLSMLHTCTQAGHRIGNVATLPTDSLRKLSQESAGGATQAEATTPLEALSAAAQTLPVEVVEAFKAIENMDVEALQRSLDKASLDLGHQGMLTKLVVPLMQNIGRLWCEGELTAAYEHFASSALRTYLLGQVQSYAASRSSPSIITVTPAGQLHEFGAVITAAAAASAGWHVIHLGSSLPAAEIAGAAIRAEARLVALSLVHPPDDADLPAQLRMLRRLLPSRVGIVAGGRACESYHQALAEIQAEVVTDIDQFYTTLSTNRRRRLADEIDRHQANLGSANG